MPTDGDTNQQPAAAPAAGLPAAGKPAAGWRAPAARLLVRYGPWLGAVAAGYLAAWLTGTTPPPPPPPPLAALAPEVPVEYEGAGYEVPAVFGPDAGPDHPLEAAGDGRPWPTKRLTYWIDFRGTEALRPAIDREHLRAAFRTAWTWWADALDLEPAEVPDEAQALVRHRFGAIDGPSGTLAWSYLADGTLAPKEQRYDAGERWTAGPPAPNLLSLPTVAAHEIGHALGLGHDAPDAPALMRPSYSAAIPREQGRDVARLVALGYARRPAPPPAAAGDRLTFPAAAAAADVADALRKAGWRVERPE